MRSVDELSELEECIDQEIRDAVALGFRLKTSCDQSACALAAVGFVRGRVGWIYAGQRLGLNNNELASITWGFDGVPADQFGSERVDFLPALHEMGRRFRERAMAGEYRKDGAQ